MVKIITTEIISSEGFRDGSEGKQTCHLQNIPTFHHPQISPLGHSELVSAHAFHHKTSLSSCFAPTHPRPHSHYPSNGLVPDTLVTNPSCFTTDNSSFDLSHLCRRIRRHQEFQPQTASHAPSTSTTSGGLPAQSPVKFFTLTGLLYTRSWSVSHYKMLGTVPTELSEAVAKQVSKCYQVKKLGSSILTAKILPRNDLVSFRPVSRRFCKVRTPLLFATIYTGALYF